jgi:hypothetical protein|tara:strand:- start:293 stop:892 length:600 start_codon:yes stop_codon:yes gene_type:complete
MSSALELAFGYKKGGILKVANKLKKASKAHASQAQTLEKIAKMNKGGGADRMKTDSEKEFDSYMKFRDKIDYQKFLQQRKKEMEQDKKRHEEKTKGIPVKKGGVIKYSKGGMPARNKKNFRPTKSGAGMTKAGVAAYRRMNPGSKLQTAVTGKVKPGSKAAKRRKSYCARSLGQLKRASAKTRNDPNSRIRQARRRWKC